MADKTFERMELIRYLEDSLETDRPVRVLRNPEGLFDGDVVADTYPVVASVEAFWCEKRSFGVLIRSVNVPADARSLFPKDHLFRRPPEVELYTGSPDTGSLARWALKRLDDWAEVCSMHVPFDPFDLRPLPDDDHGETGVTVDDILEGGDD